MERLVDDLCDIECRAMVKMIGQMVFLTMMMNWLAILNTVSWQQKFLLRQIIICPKIYASFAFIMDQHLRLEKCCGYKCC